MSPDDGRNGIALPRLRYLLSAVFISSVLADQIFGTVVVLSGTVALGYFPVILSVEGLVAGIIGVVTGFVAFVALRRIGQRSFIAGSLVASVPFALVWSGFFTLTNYQSSPPFYALFLALGLLLYIVGLLVSRQIGGSRVAVVVVVIGIATAVFYPWLLAVLIFK